MAASIIPITNEPKNKGCQWLVVISTTQAKVISSGTCTNGVFSIQAPSLEIAYNTGGVVIGLVIQTKPTEIGKLACSGIANSAAASICMGIGIMAMNNPIANARATKWRFLYQRLGALMVSPRKRKDLFLRIFSGLNKWRLMKD